MLEFSNDNQYVELSPELADLRNETIQLWARWDGTGDADQKIFEFARDENNYMYLQPTSAEGGVKFEIAVDGVVRTLYGVAPLTAGEWQHVAVTFDADTATLYVNGSAVATKTSVAMDPHQVRATSALLGRGLASGGFRGLLDNLYVYSDARTPAEILADVRAVLGAGYVPAPDAEVDHDPGDYNRDGIVNAADYTLWRDLVGQSVPLGTLADGNRDGMIDAADYGVWKSHFGVVTPPGLGGTGSAAMVEDAAPAETVVGPAVAITAGAAAALPPANLFAAESVRTTVHDEVFRSVAASRHSVLATRGDLTTLARFVAERHLTSATSADASVVAAISDHVDGDRAGGGCSADDAPPWDQVFRPMISLRTKVLR